MWSWTAIMIRYVGPPAVNVKIVKTHTDDVEPYYTVRMPDGTERQTVASKLRFDDAGLVGALVAALKR